MAVAFGFVVLSLGPSRAQTFGLTPPSPTLPPEASAPPSARQEELFQRMLREPTNHELTFEFVRVATANGDLEAAIGALEKLLFYEPRLTRAKYELGLLYQRLGSSDMAVRYYREALESPDLDVVTRNRIEATLPEAEKMRSPSRLSGFLHAGARYDTNAAYVPSSGFLRLGGLDFPVSPTVPRKPDWSLFGLAILAHDYDLQNQRGDTIETRFIGYVRHHDRFDFLDHGLFEASFGPRLALAPDALPGVTFKPYVIGGAASIRGDERLGSAGAGILLGIPIGARMSIEPGVEWRRIDYRNVNTPLLSSINSGEFVSPFVAARFALTNSVTFDARAIYRRIDTTFAWQSSDQVGGEAALTIEFDPPFEVIPRRWSISPFVRVLHTDFDAPNPAIDPFVKRRDTDWRTGAMLEMPLTAQLGVTATVQYARTESNLPNFRNEDLSVMFGPSARF